MNYNTRVNGLLEKLYRYGGSDLHLHPRTVPKIRKAGRLIDLPELPFSELDIEKEIMEMKLDSFANNKLQDEHQADYGYKIEDSLTGNVYRFRCNIAQCYDGYSLTFRNVNKVVGEPESLGFEKGFFNEIIKQPSGLLLICGPVNSGKSVTQASIIQKIANEEPCKIITLEDPIEYNYNIGSSLLIRREKGVDFNTYEYAIKAILREDPDVVMVGEMRDPETIKATCLLAETGKLVISTVHANSVDLAIERCLLSLDSQDQNLVKTALNNSLRMIVHQQLIKDFDSKGNPIQRLKYESKNFVNKGDN